MIPFILGIIVGAFGMLTFFIVVAVLYKEDRNPELLSDQELQDYAKWEEERRRRREKRRTL